MGELFELHQSCFLYAFFFLPRWQWMRLRGRRSFPGTSTHRSRASGDHSLLCSVIHPLCTQPKITWRFLAGLLRCNHCYDLLPIVISREFAILPISRSNPTWDSAQ